ncbi:hypothetical protein JOQ06_008010, partial [Pogonophryne albipinna]
VSGYKPSGCTEKLHASSRGGGGGLYMEPYPEPHTPVNVKHVAPGLQRWRLALIDSVLGRAGCVCEAIFLHLSLRPTVSRPGGRVLMDAEIGPAAAHRQPRSNAPQREGVITGAQGGRSPTGAGPRLKPKLQPGPGEDSELLFDDRQSNSTRLFGYQCLHAEVTEVVNQTVLSLSAPPHTETLFLPGMCVYAEVSL